MPGTDVVGHRFGYDSRRAVQQVPRGGVERLGHQLFAAREQKEAVGIDRIRLSTEQSTILPAVERGVIKSIVRSFRRVVMDGQIEEVFAVGKKERPTMGGVQSRIDLGGSDRRSPA